MSRITDFRQRIMDAVKAEVPQLEEVRWYDGIFDEEDIAEWSDRTPCAVVSVRRAPTSDLSTGESNVDLNVLITVVCQDEPLEADILCWDILEQLADLAKNNTFGDPNAAPPCNIKFERLRNPVLRREGVTIGVCDWMSGLTIGRKRFLDRIAVRGPDGAAITQMPRRLSAEATIQDAAGRSSAADAYHFLDDEEP